MPRPRPCQLSATTKAASASAPPPIRSNRATATISPSATAMNASRLTWSTWVKRWSSSGLSSGWIAKNRRWVVSGDNRWWKRSSRASSSGPIGRIDAGPVRAGAPTTKNRTLCIAHGVRRIVGHRRSVCVRRGITGNANGDIAVRSRRCASRCRGGLEALGVGHAVGVGSAQGVRHCAGDSTVRRRCRRRGRPAPASPQRPRRRGWRRCRRSGRSSTRRTSTATGRGASHP